MFKINKTIKKLIVFSIIYKCDFVLLLTVDYLSVKLYLKLLKVRFFSISLFM